MKILARSNVNPNKHNTVNGIYRHIKNMLKRQNGCKDVIIEPDGPNCCKIVLLYDDNSVATCTAWYSHYDYDKTVQSSTLLNWEPSFSIDTSTGTVYDDSGKVIGVAMIKTPKQPATKVGKDYDLDSIRINIADIDGVILDSDESAKKVVDTLRNRKSKYSGNRE